MPGEEGSLRRAENGIAPPLRQTAGGFQRSVKKHLIGKSLRFRRLFRQAERLRAIAARRRFFKAEPSGRRFGRPCPAFAGEASQPASFRGVRGAFLAGAHPDNSRSPGFCICPGSCRRIRNKEANSSVSRPDRPCVLRRWPSAPLPCRRGRCCLSPGHRPGLLRKAPPGRFAPPEGSWCLPHGARG